MRTKNSEHATTGKSEQASSRVTGAGRLMLLVSRLDSRDKELDPKQRKRKWGMIVLSLFALFLISFLFPSPDFRHQKIGSGTLVFPQKLAEEQKLAPAAQPGFEMPVDSFETLLKQHIHEQLPEKK